MSAIATAPTGCSGRGCVGSASRSRPYHAAAMATSAAGRLIRKISRHDAYCTSRPPAGGPIIELIPLQAVHCPTARPLSAP